MKHLPLILAAAFALATPAAADYQRIGPGHELKQAKAYCDIVSMSAGSGFYAYGSPAFVLGASLGNAIGNAIAQDQLYRNCMVLQGWERVKTKKSWRAETSGKKN